MPLRQLLFVYNATSGLGHAVLDTFHKLLSPGTYPCSLCGLTYGPTSMRPEWKRFLRTLPVPARFLYRDQLPGEYPQLLSHALPAVFAEDTTGQLTPLVTAAQLSQLDLTTLMALLYAQVDNWPAPDRE